ncbi:MAG: cation transporter [Bacteroidota bacterium]
MRKIIFIALSLAFLASCNSTVSDKSGSDSNKEVNVAAVKTVKLHVTGMTCEGCENTVKEAVNKIEGVAGTEASHIAELTTISYDTTLTDIDKISAVIDELGYKVEGPAVNASPEK